MSGAERWRRLEAIVQDALERPAEDRAAIESSVALRVSSAGDRFVLTARQVVTVSTRGVPPGIP